MCECFKIVLFFIERSLAFSSSSNDCVCVHVHFRYSEILILIINIIDLIRLCLFITRPLLSFPPRPARRVFLLRRLPLPHVRQLRERLHLAPLLHLRHRVGRRVYRQHSHPEGVAQHADRPAHHDSHPAVHGQPPQVQLRPQLGRRRRHRRQR